MKRLFLIGSAIAVAVLAVIGVQMLEAPSQSGQPHEAAVQEIGQGESPSVEPFEDEMETVLGIEVRKDRDCTVYALQITDEDGNSSTAHECISDQEPELHRYTALEIDELRDLAYADAEAAEILAIKLIESGEEEAGLEYVYRSIALESGQSFSAIKRAHNTFYSTVVGAEAPDWEPKPNFHAMQQAYVFAAVREALTGVNETASPRMNLEEHGFTDFQSLDAKARKALETMAQVEIDVVGANTIREKIDA